MKPYITLFRADLTIKNYNRILKFSWLLIGIIVYLTSVCFKPLVLRNNTNFNSVASGNWTVVTWTPSTPVPASLGNNDVVQIGSSTSTCNISFSGPMTFGNSITLRIKAGSSLTINGNFSVGNSILLVVESGGTLIVNGNLTFTNGGSDVTINGEMDVTGNLIASSNNSGTYSGTGSVQVGGTVTDTNNKFAAWLINTNNRFAVLSSNWSSNAGTWSNVAGGVAVANPSTYSNVHIETYTTTNTSYNVAMDVTSETVATLIVGANNSLKIKAGKSLFVKGAVTINGTLTIESNSTGTGVFGVSSSVSIAGTGSIAIQRDCQGQVYHYISTPFSNTNASFFAASNQFYRYNEASFTANNQWDFGWELVSSGTLERARGYALYYYPTVWTFTGTPAQLNQGTINYSLQFSGLDQGNTNKSSKSWNLVGNPYYSSLDANAFINANLGVMTGSLYFWDTGSAVYSSSDYATYTKTGVSTAASASPRTGGSFTPNGTIEMGQAFLVSAKSAGSLTFTQSMQTAKASSHFFKSIPVESKIDQLSIDLIDADGNSNNLLIGISDSVSNKYTEGYDGLKRKGNPEISFYAIKDQKECAIGAFPPSTTEFEVALAFEAESAVSMNVSIARFNNGNYSGIFNLYDKQTGITTQCKEGMSYQLQANAGLNKDRLYLKYTPASLSVSTHQLNIAASESSTASFEILSNTNWKIECPSWIKASTQLGQENQSLTVKLSENKSINPRFGLVKVNVSGLKPEIIQVKQEKGSPFLQLSTVQFNAKGTKDTLNLYIDTNSAWTITSIPIWVEVSKSRGDSAEMIQIIVNQNTSEAQRTVKLDVEVPGLLVQHLNITQSATTSIASKNKKLDLKIFPNPNSGILNVNWASEALGEISLIVSDMSGHIIQEVKVLKTELILDEQLNLSNLSEGVYIFEIKSKTSHSIHLIQKK